MRSDRAAVVQLDNKASSTALVAPLDSDGAPQHVVTQTVRVGAHCARPALRATYALREGGRLMLSVTHFTMSWSLLRYRVDGGFSSTISNNVQIKPAQDSIGT